MSKRLRDKEAWIVTAKREQAYEKEHPELIEEKVTELKEIRKQKDMTRADQIDFEQAVYDAFGQVKDFTLAMRIARYFYEKAEKEIIEKAMRWIEWNSKNGGCIYDGWKDDFPKEMIENNEL